MVKTINLFGQPPDDFSKKWIFNNMPRHPKSGDINLLAKVATGLVLPILGSFFLGSYLDQRLGTSPWLTLLLLILGVVFGFTWLYKTVTDRDDE